MTLVRKPSDLRLAVVLLAAGEGSRMGSIPKALLYKDGKSLLECFCSSIKALNPIEFIVITGFHAQLIEPEIQRLSKQLNLGITIVHNQNAHTGQTSSVRLALESITNSFDVLAMCLSDQPNIGETELTVLLDQFISRTPDQDVVMPMVNGQRGNPVLFSSKAVKEMLKSPGMVCRSFMDKHPERIKVFNADSDAFTLDVDTDVDIERLGLKRF